MPKQPTHYKPMRKRTLRPRNKAWYVVFAMHIQESFKDPLFRNVALYIVVGSIVTGVLFKIVTPIYGPIQNPFSLSGIIFIFFDLLISATIIEGARSQIKRHEQEAELYKGLPDDYRTMSTDELADLVRRTDILTTLKSRFGSAGRTMFDNAKSLHEVDEEKKMLAKQFPKQRGDIEIMAEIRRI